MISLTDYCRALFQHTAAVENDRFQTDNEEPQSHCCVWETYALTPSFVILRTLRHENAFDIVVPSLLADLA
jgi:hypothetical protein